MTPKISENLRTNFNPKFTVIKKSVIGIKMSADTEVFIMQRLVT